MLYFCVLVYCLYLGYRIVRDVCRLYDPELDRPGGFWFIPGFVCTEITSVLGIDMCMNQLTSFVSVYVRSRVFLM